MVTKRLTCTWSGRSTFGAHAYMFNRDVPEITQEEIDDDDFIRGEEPPRTAERLVLHGGRARAADFDTEAQ